MIYTSKEYLEDTDRIWMTDNVDPNMLLTLLYKLTRFSQVKTRIKKILTALSQSKKNPVQLIYQYLKLKVKAKAAET